MEAVTNGFAIASLWRFGSTRSGSVRPYLEIVLGLKSLDTKWQSPCCTSTLDERWGYYGAGIGAMFPLGPHDSRAPLLNVNARFHRTGEGSYFESESLRAQNGEFDYADIELRANALTVGLGMVFIGL